MENKIHLCLVPSRILKNVVRLGDYTPSNTILHIVFKYIINVVTFYCYSTCLLWNIKIKLIHYHITIKYPKTLLYFPCCFYNLLIFNVILLRFFWRFILKLINRISYIKIFAISKASSISIIYFIWYLPKSWCLHINICNF